MSINKNMMLMKTFMSLLLLLNTVNTEDDFCDVKAETCSYNEKYILYDVNPPEGFNLRRDVYMRFAIMLFEAKNNWKLILPPWYDLYHWQNRKSKPIPWSTFFDLESLKKFSPVLEINEVFAKIDSKILTIDSLYILQNFPNAFEDGDFSDKWQIDHKCNYDGKFWSYENITVKETTCVKFQGRISKLWELIALHSSDKVVMFAHGEIPLHDTYGTKIFWDCRKSMKFNKELVETAKKFIFDHFNCNKNCSYISVHWRRQDFARARRKDIPTIKGTVKQINNFIKKNNPHINDIFIATDATNSELTQLKNYLNDLGYKVHSYIPSQLELDKFFDGGVAIIDQIVCSYATYFIGTYESTFTYRIQEEREILGYDSSTTFNRLCPDSGICEKPSEWTIIQ